MTLKGKIFVYSMLGLTVASQILPSFQFRLNAYNKDLMKTGTEQAGFAKTGQNQKDLAATDSSSLNKVLPGSPIGQEPDSALPRSGLGFFPSIAGESKAKVWEEWSIFTFRDKEVLDQKLDGFMHNDILIHAINDPALAALGSEAIDRLIKIILSPAENTAPKLFEQMELSNLRFGETGQFLLDTKGQPVWPSRSELQKSLTRLSNVIKENWQIDRPLLISSFGGNRVQILVGCREEYPSRGELIFSFEGKLNAWDRKLDFLSRTKGVGTTGFEEPIDSLLKDLKIGLDSLENDSVPAR